MNNTGKEKWYVRLLNWLSNNFSYVQLIFFLLTLTIGFLANIKFKTEFDGYIIALLVFLGIDFIIFAKGFLEKITTNTSDSLNILKDNRKSDLIFSTTRPTDINIGNVYAEHCLFINGTSMAFTHDTHCLNKLNNMIDRGVEVILMITDFQNPCIDNYLREVFGKTRAQRKRTKEDFEDFKINLDRRIKIIYTDVFIPMAFTAIDYKDKLTAYSAIYSKHYLLKKTGSKADSFFLTVRPSSPAFEIYKKQIALIVNNDGKLSKSHHKDDKNSTL